MYPPLAGEALAPVSLGKVISIRATIASNAVMIEKILVFIRRYFSQTRVNASRRNRSGIGISHYHQSLKLLIVPSDEEFTTLSVESSNEWKDTRFGAMCHGFSFIAIAINTYGMSSSLNTSISV
jgi:hypothetical protein